MTLKEQIEKNFVLARKEKNEAVVSTLGMLRAAILNAEIAGGRKEFGDDDILKVISSEVKKHKDSIVEYEKGGRADLVSKEKAELGILEKYLPAELPEEELGKIVEEKVYFSHNTVTMTLEKGTLYEVVKFMKKNPDTGEYFEVPQSQARVAQVLANGNFVTVLLRNGNIIRK